jgi:hypothetical protein
VCKSMQQLRISSDNRTKDADSISHTNDRRIQIVVEVEVMNFK